MKNLPKLLALCLAFIMVFSVTPVSLAAQDEACPLIFLPGIDSSIIYADVNDTSTAMTYPGKDELVEVVKETIAPALIVYAADKDIEKLTEVVCGELNTLFEGWFNNADGSAKGNSGAVVKYPAASSIAKNSFLPFEWDWRGNPLEVAEELNRYINYITENTGFDKVALSAHSLGSVVVLSYISIYGDSKVSGVVFDTPALDGVDYVGELLAGNIETDGQALINIINAFLGTTENGDIAESLTDIFTLAGIPAELSSLFNSVLDQIAPVLYRDTFVPLFGRWLTIWSMVPSEDIDEAMDYIFTEYLTDEESMILKGKIEEYNSTVRTDAHKTLLDFDEDGRFAVISRYGYSSLPVSEKWTEMSDTVIETKNSSFGATTVTYGDYFSEEYLKGKDAKYISPDKTVDAATCLFPEKTWFIKGALHQETVYTIPLYKDLLFGEAEATCDSFSLSRFSVFDREVGELTVDNTVPKKVEKKSPLKVLFDFLKMLFARFIAFFKK